MNTEQQCFAQLREAIPDAMRLMDSPRASLSLRDYSASLEVSERHALQDGSDLIALAAAEAGRIYGAATGEALKKELERRFLVLTANHHGVDFHPEFLQGDMMLALSCRHAVPLFACGGVPCNNMSFPRGILLPPKSADTTLPGRYAALPVGDRHAFVSAQIPFTEEHLVKAVRAAAKALRSGELTATEHAFIQLVLQEIYRDSSVLRQASFRDQMSAANALLWRRLAAPDLSLPPLVSLEFQHLCALLIADDLHNPASLMHDLILEPQLCAALFGSLNGARACWKVEEGQIRHGSFLFWALDEKGRGFALLPDFKRGEVYAPRRPDLRFPLEASALSEALRSEKLLPSLYSAFAVTALIRGLSCAGGVYQYAYLPAMRQGTAAALRLCGDSRAEALAGSCPLGAGFHAFMAPDADGRGEHAAGALDILRHGGLSAADWEAFASVSLREAFYCAAPFEYEDILPPDSRVCGWLEAMRAPSPLLLAPEEPHA